MNDIPSSVYRLRLNQEISFKKAIQLIPYFAKLGVEGIYCSPIFEAFSHGYDITNPNRINPVLGSAEDFDLFVSKLQKNKMKLILDVVPNHMGIKGDTNKWWLDVLEKGQTSRFASFFDINWKARPRGKILLPILNGPYGQELKNGHIELIFNNGFWIRYFDYLLPIRPSTYPSAESLPLIQQNKDLLHKLLEKQFYRLAHWIVAGQKINYRRFFNISELIGICIEKKRVLDTHHRLIFKWIKSGKVQGLRIDHPDGLYDPTQYLKRVREKTPSLIWVEKILSFKEILPETWDVEGTVGYDFLNQLSGLFVQKRNERAMTAIYNQFIGQKSSFEEIHYNRRKRFIALQMSSEVNFLGLLLRNLSERDRKFRDFTKADLTRACLEIIACFPVYRTYIKPEMVVRKKDRNYVILAIESAKKKAPEIDALVFHYIRDLLLLEYVCSYKEKKLATEFLMRFQQITAPVMAKGLEDSTFYVYNRLISLNEVGGSPSHFGVSKSQFHAFNRQKIARWPLGALTSSTHDTKYSENARLRIHALSETPQKWKALIFDWQKQNQKYKTRIKGVFYPDPNLEYYLYQLLLAIWPADRKRIWICFNKAMREAGIYTSWRTINEKYEDAAKKFFTKILKPAKSNLFYSSFCRFQKEIAQYGDQNSLSALVLKMGSCGIVDIYQGDEIMNYSLVDPDNRRRVIFGSLDKILKQKKNLKMQITSKALKFRQKNKELFLKGSYIPLKGPQHVVAFMRQWNNQKAIVIARRFFSEEKTGGKVLLPKGSKILRNIFTEQTVDVHSDGLYLDQIFKEHPFAILYE